MPIAHAGLDDVGDTKVVRYVRGVLVASGVLPDRDEHLHRLERWVTNTVAAVSDPDDRLVVHRYVHWYLLHRLRARITPQRPVTVEQAKRLRSHAITAVAVLRAVRAEGSSLAALSETDVSEWLAGRQVAGRTWLGAFLRWAYRQRLCTVTLPAQQWTGPRSRIDHAHRWDLARRLLHDDTLPLADRIAGLFVVLYVQTASSLCALRCDQIQPTPSGARLLFGTTPVDLPTGLVTLITALRTRRAGTEREATPWLFPGRPRTQPITPGQLTNRLNAIGVTVRQARTTALLQLAVELPAAVLARCLGIDVTSAVAWQRAASGDWHTYAARIADGQSSLRTI
ncbi:hypothetical protein [Dactylosporangium matsuzakiense]|uniref:Site-specific recombinase XerD n=1 Tax=Dactylosporangium matsuzakiense TaxID=53360 RepID=A0A9W6KRJ0_9ACTN|nr:hypothetical protein [Dactylosporangium matsuzakiense]GLL05917.1 hypothetical protein GCM10017581_076650 [Dactylosporangium matsuzakiense]